MIGGLVLMWPLMWPIRSFCCCRREEIGIVSPDLQTTQISKGGTMDTSGPEQLSRILQMSLSPVALISGVGLLLISMNSRIGRAIDRVRALSDEPAPLDDLAKEQRAVQIRILYCRAVILRRSITLASLSILFAAVIALCILAMYNFDLNLHGLVMALWGAALVCLVVSLALFVHDVTLTLQALRHSLEGHLKSCAD